MTSFWWGAAVLGGNKGFLECGIFGGNPVRSPVLPSRDVEGVCNKLQILIDDESI